MTQFGLSADRDSGHSPNSMPKTLNGDIYLSIRLIATIKMVVIAGKWQIFSQFFNKLARWGNKATLNRACRTYIVILLNKMDRVIGDERSQQTLCLFYTN